MSVIDRLKELGIELPQPSARGIYRPALMSGNIIYVSGQVAVRDGNVVHPGRLGEGVTLEQGIEAARVAAINALGAARFAFGRMDDLRLLRMVGYVACTPEFTQQPQVVDGASELVREVLGNRGVGTRLALGVSSLPANSPVEIEMQLEIRP
jgi:enamine deaminase RidA (YjgF/YER057c/UK114 family)